MEVSDEQAERAQFQSEENMLSQRSPDAAWAWLGVLAKKTSSTAWALEEP